MRREEVKGDRKITIQPMTAADLDAVMRIEEASYTQPWKRSMFETDLRGNPFARFFVARDADAGAVTGYVCFWKVFAELHLMNLAVDPDRRRSGIGEELARWTLSWAGENGVRLITLEVRASNEAAKHLYDKLGFKRVGVRHNYYRDPREDALIMNWSEGSPLEKEVGDDGETV
ncbi:MAG TPA: ribosomal protein S18-alanine N-acetyltransferase [Nitrospiria bacterium]|nr:ribosomal protein S18-alanine N-acetyltransferase [Nitrospiria bacterium]